MAEPVNVHRMIVRGRPFQIHVQAARGAHAACCYRAWDDGRTLDVLRDRAAAPIELIATSEQDAVRRARDFLTLAIQAITCDACGGVIVVQCDIQRRQPEVSLVVTCRDCGRPHLTRLPGEIVRDDLG